MTEIIHAVVSFLAVVNPIGTVPVFLALTDGASLNRRRDIARKAVLIAFAILLAFLVLGRMILSLFGVTLSAFRVAGGIIIFAIAYQLLQAKPSHVNTLREGEQSESLEKHDVTVTPLATPILAGPGTIATTLALGSHAVLANFSVFLGIIVVLSLTYLVFHYAPWWSDHLGQTEMNIITRMMGLILAVIAVQMAASGIRGLFPNL